jgi:nitrogen fixation/metabolism regulation signal transduction histidine kinase
MAFRRFRDVITIRVSLLAISFVAMFTLLQLELYRVSVLIIFVLVVFQVIGLIRYVDRTNRKLTQFLQSIRQADFSSSFSDQGLGNTFEGLSTEFNQIIEAFKHYRAEKEEHFNYLQTVVQHIPIGILVFRRDGMVDIFNNAAKKLLKARNVRFVQDLATVKPDFPEILLKMRSGDSTLQKIFIEDELLQLAITATEFRMRNTDFVLVSIQDISTELDEKEIESWQRMIRVLTHEITNSITPITSLASTVHEVMFEERDGVKALGKLDPEEVESMEGALLTIQSRSQGLLNFVETYRNLTRIPKPNFRYFKVAEFFERTRQLMKPKIDELGIDCSVTVFPPDMMITADPDLLDQVVINLVLNAIDAVREVAKPQITILATLNNYNRVTMEFRDNGAGIKPDIMDKIFMPFFTSKKHGSGVGLSLSRQIMHLHKGTISVKSKPEGGTVFTLTF